MLERRSPVVAMDRESEELAMSREATGSPPHLLVVSAGNSRDPGPAWSGRRLGGGRGGGCNDSIGEEIGGCSHHHRCSPKHPPV